MGIYRTYSVIMGSSEESNLKGPKPFMILSLIHIYINMTLNYYAHATSDSAMAEMERLIA